MMAELSATGARRLRTWRKGARWNVSEYGRRDEGARAQVMMGCMYALRRLP